LLPRVRVCFRHFLELWEDNTMMSFALLGDDCTVFYISNLIETDQATIKSMPRRKLRAKIEKAMQRM
jgi:hypothetical protein